MKQDEERDNAKWLMRYGFTTQPDGRVLYQLETGQQVRIKASNEARYRADLNRRRDKAFGPAFRFTLPTAAEMVWSFSPAGRTAARAAKQARLHGASQALSLARLAGA